MGVLPTEVGVYMYTPTSAGSPWRVDGPIIFLLIRIGVYFALKTNGR